MYLIELQHLSILHEIHGASYLNPSVFIKYSYINISFSCSINHFCTLAGFVRNWRRKNLESKC